MNTAARWFILKKDTFSKGVNPAHLATIDYGEMKCVPLFTGTQSAKDALEELAQLFGDSEIGCHSQTRQMASLLGRLAQDGATHVLIDCHIGTPDAIPISAAVIAFEMAS